MGWGGVQGSITYLGQEQVLTVLGVNFHASGCGDEEDGGKDVSRATIIRAMGHEHRGIAAKRHRRRHVLWVNAGH